MTLPVQIAGGRGRIAAVFAVLLAFMLAAIPALAAELVPLTGRVVDNAGMLDASAKAALDQKLAAFEQKSSDQIVVLTIDDLGGEPIENFANRQFRAWRLGQAGEDNGVLLVVAKNDRKMRIEVGYGLEGTLTDLHSRLIIENTMLPAFRAGDFSKGITGAVDDIVMVLEGNAAELEARAKRNPPEEQGEPMFETLFVLLWCAIFFGGFAISFLAPIFGKKLGPGRYRWLGMNIQLGGGGGGGTHYGGGSPGGWSSGSGGGGFSGGGGSSGGGGASGGW